jgi:chromosome segregation ATPase
MPPVPAPCVAGSSANSGVQQAGYTTPGPDSNKPTVTGCQLGLKGDETVLERALELTAKLAVTEEQKKELVCRVQQLTASLDEKQAAIQQAEHEVLVASDELNRARAELQRWREQVASLRDKLNGAEKENLETLQSIVGVLEKMLEADKQKEEKLEPPPDTELPKVPPQK